MMWALIPSAQKLVPRRRRGSGVAEKLLTRTYRAAPPMPEPLRSRLRDAYRADIMSTANLIQRDLSHWL
jgi:hypothetical protein